MRYTNTSKTLSLVFHSLAFLAFGALGIYFGVFVVPGYFSTNQTYIEFSDELHLISNSYIFYLELAVIGIAIAAVAVKGVLSAVKSIQNGGDKEVVDSFSAFIAEGWLAAIFFLLNGGLFFGVISGDSNVWFVIVMCLLFTILTLIAVNIPTVKLFDGKDSTPLIENLSFAGIAAGSPIFLLPVLSAIFMDEGLVGKINVSLVNTQLLLVAAIGALVLAASIISLLSVEKKIKNISSYTTCAASVLSGGIMILLAILNFSWDDKKVFIWNFKPLGVYPSTWGNAYNVMLIIFGVAIICLGMAIIAFPNKKRK